MRYSSLTAVLLLSLAACDAAGIDEDPSTAELAANRNSIVPEAERAAAREMDGPNETTGVESNELLGFVALGGEFPGLEGRVLRARVITLAPEARLAVHRHEARPGVAYVIEGELIEHRNDDPPALRRAGEASFENTGVVHWWENTSRAPAKVIVVDIVPEGT